MSSTQTTQEDKNDLHEVLITSSTDSTHLLHHNLHQLSEFQGDQITEKRTDVFRIGFVNINGIPKQAKNPKNKNIERFINKYNFDFLGLAETNCFWPLAQDENKWHERVREWNLQHSKSVLSYYTKPIIPELNQPGGVISMALNSTTNKVFSSGKDEPLGRWSWITLRGKNNIKTTIITGYRPCDNSYGNNNVLLQQQRYLQAQRIEDCP